jgi:hypothetical protein
MKSLASLDEVGEFYKSETLLNLSIAATEVSQETKIVLICQLHACLQGTVFSLDINNCSTAAFARRP